MARDGLTALRLGTLDYQAGLATQYRMVEARLRDEITDALILLEHPHVYTLGRGASEAYLVSPPANVPVHRVSRGGQVTYHGPGQLVGYPILKLEGKARDVHAYLRDLEEAIIRALAEVGIAAERRDGFTGVWVGARKIASIGVGIRRWVTLHGFAINVSTDLSYFQHIVPCGIADCAMTSIAEEQPEGASVESFADVMETAFAETFQYPALKRTDEAVAQLIAAEDNFPGAIAS